MKKIFSIFFLFLGINIFFFWGLWGTYFQQDEWFLFGRAIYQLQHLPWSVFNFASNHFWPLGNITWIILYRLFKLEAFYYGVFAIVIQSVVATALYFFLERIIQKSKVSLLLSLLFSVSFPTMQPVVWFVIPPFLPPSVLFILIFFIFLIKFSKEKLISNKNLIILFVLFLLGFSFREEAVALLFLFPTYLYLFKRSFLQDNRKKLLILFICFFSIIAARFILQGFIGEKVSFEQGSRKAMAFYNIISSPPKMVIQNFIELEQVWQIARGYIKLANPRAATDGYIVETVVFEEIILALFIPFASLLTYALIKSKKQDRKIILFALLWILVSSIIIAPQSRRLFFLESRYLYMGNIGVLLLVYGLLHSVEKSMKNKRIGLCIRFTYIFLALVFVGYSYVKIQSFINSYGIRSKERVQIVQQIINKYPRISEQTVFYIECRAGGECVPNLIFPFQSGVGQMLLVMYAHQNEEAYAPFFKDFYLWDWEAQGYKKIDGYGFGYYRQEEVLLKDFKKGKFLPQEIIALSYDRSTNKIEDVSKKFQNRLIKRAAPPSREY